MSPASIAVARWARRLFRREWRQQALVLALLTLAVAAAIGFAAASHNTVGVSENAVFGAANHRYEVDAPDLRTLPADLAAARARFGAADAIARWSRPIPGSVESLEFRAQDPDGPLSGPMLALRSGRYPGRAGEIAVTDGVADTFALGLGSAFALDGTRRRVVGMVENPSDLRSDFALVAPADVGALQSLTILVGGSGSFDEVRELREFGATHLPNAEVSTRDDVKQGEAAVAVLGVATIALVLVSLVAAAGFVTVAQRRLRQLGMFGAIGATERQLRLVVVANGALIGAVAAAAGAAIGLIAWVAVAPRMEQAVGHRIDVWNVPWWVVASALALVVVAATAAAWWPARMVARVPITSALSGRPPRPRPARHSAALAAALIGVGVACLVASGQRSAALIVAGTLASAAGVLLLSPIAIRLLAGVTRWLPIAMRLAVRDLVRNRARSGVALAAISLTLGIPAAVVVTATAAEQSGGKGNVSAAQLLLWTRDASHPAGVSPLYTQDPDDAGFSPVLPRLAAQELDAMQRQVERIAAALEGPSVAALELATDPALPATPEGRLAVTLAQRTEIGYLDVAPLFAATPQLLERYDLDPERVGADVDVLTVAPSERLPQAGRELLQSDALWFANALGDRTGRPGPTPVGRVQTLTDGYTSLPGSFATRAMLGRRGWDSTRVGWLLESATPFTQEQIRTARELAAGAGLLLESRREEESLVTLRWGATVVGLLLALGVLAMTVGLVRGEAARDLRTLAATGATRAIRRTLTATTAGTLALLGALLGTGGAYLGLGATRLDDIGALTPVPVMQLLMILIGVPAIAGAAGWLLAGREPPVLSRQALE